ncbi:MAG: phosphoenolpyruvate--protein phosphotransferase [Pseudomonadales bacterium]|jgi:phosphotransferase system enzyme I (PtsP)
MAYSAARIAQLIDDSSSRDEFLHAVVREVQGALKVATCSVYLEEEQSGHLLLAASEGIDHGITHLGELARFVGDGRLYWLEEPQTASGKPSANGPAGSRNRARDSMAMLGVPIRRDRRVVGAIVLHGVARQAISDADEAVLLTLSVQVAIALRKLAYAAPHGADRESSAQARFSGVAGAPGVAIARAVFPALLTDLERVPDRQADDPAAEAERYQQAVRSLLVELHAGRERLRDLRPDGLDEVLDVYRQIVTDDLFAEAVLARIRAGKWAPTAIRETVVTLGDALMAAEDERLRTRAEDVRAVGRLLLLHLSDATRETYPDRCVLVGTEVNLVRMAGVPAEKLGGIVSFEGSTLSHAALLARSLGIPAVMGIGELPRETYGGCLLVVDGYAGRVVANPLPAVLVEYQRLEREELALAEELRADETRHARTLDGIDIPVRVNISLSADVDRSRAGAQGVGLYRSEFPFMLRDSLPSEGEQLETYRKIIEAFAPEPVVMRTLDVGGDKPLSYLPGTERNSFLGARGIRISLDHPEIFVSQIRAMLRASLGFDNLRLLLPMVSTVTEVDQAIGLIRHARASLAADGIETKEVPIGVMVEVPSLLFQLTALARHIDFFSIGTNDLTQYVMAAARENREVASLHDHLQPAVLCAIHAIIEAAHSCGRKVSVCGELASDPLGVVPLVGMDVDELSVAPSALGRVKRIVRSVSSTQARTLANRLLSHTDVRVVRAEIADTLEHAGLGGLLRAGR